MGNRAHTGAVAIAAALLLTGCASGGATPEERAKHWETTRQQLETWAQLARENNAVAWARVKVNGRGEVWLKEAAGIDLGAEAEMFLIVNPSSASKRAEGVEE